MSGHEEFTSSAGHHHVYPRISRLGNDLKGRTALYVLAAHLGVTAVRNMENIIKSAEDRQFLETVANVMFKDTEHLPVQRMLGHSVMVV